MIKKYFSCFFPTDVHYSKVKAGDRVTVRANYLVMSDWYGTVMKYGELVSVEKSKPTVLNYPLFDGENLIESASVVIENGVIASVAETENVDSNYLLMPGLIDAHTHMNTMEQIQMMLKNVFKDICKTAHKNHLKVAVHAVSVKAVEMSVDCGADILIHVPMKEKFPKDLAQKIAEKDIVAAPTLVMMNTFANRIRNGYKPSDYANAVNAVNLMHSCGVRILAGTDANMGSFAPAVSYGTSMHHEMEMLMQAGLTPLEALKAATSNIAEAFNIKNIGVIAPGQPATMILIEGRPDRQITDSANIRQVWINGEPLL